MVIWGLALANPLSSHAPPISCSAGHVRREDLLARWIQNISPVWAGKSSVFREFSEGALERAKMSLDRAAAYPEASGSAQTHFGPHQAGGGSTF